MFALLCVCIIYDVYSFYLTILLHIVPFFHLYFFRELEKYGIHSYTWKNKNDGLGSGGESEI